MADIMHCPHCGRNLALVGRIHRCEPLRDKVKAAVDLANAKTKPGMVKIGAPVIVGVDMASGPDQTVGAIVHMDEGGVKFTPVSADELYAVTSPGQMADILKASKKPKRDRAAYMRDYRASKKGSA